MGTKKKRAFNRRQMAIIQLIRDKKAAGASSISLDEIVDLCKSKDLMPKVSEGSERQTVLATMNVIVRRLQESGVRIEKSGAIGRGAKCEFFI